jgi:hypothetical protein
MQGWFKIYKSMYITGYLNESEKNYMIISKDTEKAFIKIQHPFTIITMNKLGIEEI